MNRIFVDMDGVIVDFDAYKNMHGLTGDEVKKKRNAYLEMPIIPGAKEAISSLIGMGFEVWIATKPPTGISYAYSDKAAWVLKHFPELKRRIIMTHDKGLLGDSGDFLCDDRPHKANCRKFPGTLLEFINGFHWPQALEIFRKHRKKGLITHKNDRMRVSDLHKDQAAYLRLEPLVRDLINAVESIQDWGGTQVGNKILELESVINYRYIAEIENE